MFDNTLMNGQVVNITAKTPTYIKTIKEFNKSRREIAYADESLRIMIEIFVNP